MDSEEHLTFGMLLRRYRASVGLTQEQLAEQAHLSTRAISALEQGANHTPRRDTLQLLAEALSLAGQERAAFEAAARRPVGGPNAPGGGSSTRRQDGAEAATTLGNARAAGLPSESLPTGTLTFLLTDVEGSTRLWEEHPQEMRAALARHDTLVEAAVAQYEGRVVRPRGEGDSRFAVFARATDAVAAAADMQQALFTEPWPPGVVLRVRMALHTGEAHVRAGDYYGSAVNRCARLRAVANSGQILLSQATYDLIRDNLPPGVSLRDLGEHRLKDLTRPEPIFQLGGVDLPAEFPALKTLDNRPHNLPVQVTPLIGREEELTHLETLVRRPEVRLVTLTGPGGTGKTRVAVQIAADLLDDFPDGVYVVDLAPLSDPQLVLPTIAQTLGLTESGGQPLRETVPWFLRDKQLLLVLDNFEHVVAAAPVAQDLLRGAAGLKVLVTSRVVLRLYGEQEYPVPPLDVPVVRQLPTVAALSQYAAVALFIARAQLVKPDFAVTNETAPAVAEICVRLDGLPLAIELAAARSKVLSPPGLLTRLDSRLRLLTGGARDLPPRHQTLRAAIDWSYDLLSSGEQTLFAWLSVFVGGCTLEAVEDVCARAGGLAMDVLDGLSSLVDKSLLQQNEDAVSAVPRFLMLDTIREYARERLVQSGPEGELRAAHAQHFVALAEAAEPHLTGAQQVMWLARLEREHDNLRAVLRWTQESKTTVVGLRLAAALGPFWHVRGHLSEGRTWLHSLLAEGQSHETGVEATAVRAKALLGAGALAREQGAYAEVTALVEESLTLFWQQGDKRGIARSLRELGGVALAHDDLEQARVLYEQSLALFRELDDKEGIASSLMGLAGLLYRQGDHAQARALWEEALALFRELGNKQGIARSLVNLGSLADLHGDIGQALAPLEESLALHRELGDKEGIAWSLGSLGSVAYMLGDYTQAKVRYEQSLTLVQELGEKAGTAKVLTRVGSVAYKQGDNARAREFWEESLALRQELGEKYGIAECLEWIAIMIPAQGDRRTALERAARLFGAAAALREAISTALEPYQHADHDREVAAGRAVLGDAVFDAAWAVGAAMPLEQAIVYALEGTHSATDTTGGTE
jgi:predicted ATPase/class 3 adenylate cyclase/DNA-binding XRE family transcriptional regulator